MIFSVLAFVALITSMCIKEREKSLSVQSLNCLFEAAYDFVISAYTGAVLGIINFIRSFLFKNRDRFCKKAYRLLLLVFESFIIINCILTWGGTISLLPSLGSIFRTYCLWQTDMKLVRLSGMTTAITYGLYYVYYDSWFMVFGYLILFLTAIYAIIKNDIKIKEHTVNNEAI